MPIDIETTDRWPLWQHVFKELLTNGAIDSDNFPEFVRDVNGTRKNWLNDVLRTLASPSSHRNRVKYGFTEHRNGSFRGAIVRVGRSQYIWDKDIRIGGGKHDILYTDDKVIRRYNQRQWWFRSLGHFTIEDTPAEEPVPEQAEVEQAPAPTVLRPVKTRRVPGMEEHEVVEGYRVLSMEGDKLVVQGHGKLIIATISETFGLGVEA